MTTEQVTKKEPHTFFSDWDELHLYTSFIEDHSCMSGITPYFSGYLNAEQVDYSFQKTLLISF